MLLRQYLVVLMQWFLKSNMYRHKSLIILNKNRAIITLHLDVNSCMKVANMRWRKNGTTQVSETCREREMKGNGKLKN